jgi:hypothetical protein
MFELLLLEVKEFTMKQLKCQWKVKEQRSRIMTIIVYISIKILAVSTKWWAGVSRYFRRMTDELHFANTGQMVSFGLYY